MSLDAASSLASDHPLSALVAATDAVSPANLTTGELASGRPNGGGEILLCSGLWGLGTFGEVTAFLWVAVSLLEECLAWFWTLLTEASARRDLCMRLCLVSPCSCVSACLCVTSVSLPVCVLESSYLCICRCVCMLTCMSPCLCAHICVSVHVCVHMQTLELWHRTLL